MKIKNETLFIYFFTNQHSGDGLKLAYLGGREGEQHISATPKFKGVPRHTAQAVMDLSGNVARIKEEEED